MNIVEVSIRKISVVVVFSFLFLVLTASVTSAQNTYAQEIKVEGGAYAQGMIATRDGGNALLFVNYDSDNFLVRKVTASGKKVWQRELHQDDFQASEVAELSDGSYILTGNTDNGGSAFASLIKLTARGKIDWQKSIAESSPFTFLTSVVSSGDGGFFAAGTYVPLSIPLQLAGANSGGSGLIVAGFESSGQMRWGKVYSDDFSPDPPAIFITSDQELIVVAPIDSPSRGQVTLVLKLDSSGNLIWKRALMKKKVYFISGAVTDDGGCVLNFISDRSRSGVFLIRLSSNGDVLWKKRFRVDSQISEGSAVTQSADGSFAVTGTVYSTDGKTNGFVAKLSSNGQVISGMISNTAGVDFPQFILPASDSGYVVFGSSANSFLLKLDDNANLPGCNLFSTATIAKRKFGKLKTSSPGITTSDWIPQEGASDIRSKKLKVTSSSFCP